MATTSACSTDKEKEEFKLYEKERWFSHTAALSYGLFFLIVGIPVWWLTTTVYRAELPYSEIKKAFQMTPTLGIDIELVMVGEDVHPINMAKFGELAQETFEKMSSRNDYISMKYSGSLRPSSPAEQKLFASISSTDELEKVSQPLGEDKYTIYIISLKSAESLPLPFVSRSRQIFVSADKDSSKLPEVIPTLEVICNEIFRPSALSRTFQVVHGAPLNDKELLRSVRFDSSYTLVFTLLVPEPSKVLASWDISTAVEEYLFDLKSNLSQHIDLKIKSQVLYYETLPIKAKRMEAKNYNYLTPADIPHLINPIEARLGSFVNTNPTLNFIIYVPTSKQYPLYLHDEQEKIMSTSSFLVPRWGGFYIYNVNSTAASHPVEHHVNHGEVFTELLPQIRALLGFTDFLTNSVLSRSPVSDSALAQWELDQWMRQKTIENIGTSTHALHSLSNLVQNIRNMVINDDISEQVTESVRAILESHRQLNRGSVTEAFVASKQAVKCADEAFFDTSLLELLYFPEDQKFAIYIPLFLPVGIPLLISAVSAVKWFKGSKPKLSDKRKID